MLPPMANDKRNPSSLKAHINDSTHPQPMHRAAKRSASPPPPPPQLQPIDDHAPQFKKLKRDGDSNSNRSLSQPELANKPMRMRSTTPSDPIVSKVINGRARSVPLFSTCANIVHIDLRNPPPSPRRPRSRSPSKEPELRILSGPSSFPRLDTIQDEAAVELPTDSSVPVEHTTIPTILEPPSTPATQRPLAFISMSPLTPLPETPLPSNSMAVTKGRYNGNGWATHLEEDETEVCTVSYVQFLDFDISLRIIQLIWPLLAFQTSLQLLIPRTKIAFPHIPLHPIQLSMHPLLRRHRQMFQRQRRHCPLLQRTQLHLLPRLTRLQSS